MSFELKISEFRQRLRDLGANPEHERIVLDSWARARPLSEGKRKPEHFLPSRLLAELPAIIQDLTRLVTPVTTHSGEDGSTRLLLRLQDGQSIESVLLPRDGVCVSSQVGCAVGCRFCMTGRGGLQRQLGSAEIVAQVVLARTMRPVRKVVFMGMGEPSHNLGNVLEAIETLGTHGSIAHKQLVFSTVGDRRVFERLPQGRVKPALALSLHTTKADLRAQLLPRAPRIDPAELVELAETYARATHYPIQYQWTLLEGVNDGDDELQEILRLLTGKYAILNFILYNPVDGSDYRRPSVERAREMLRFLHTRRVLTKIRNSAGQDIEGGCGQLRARQTKPV